MRNPAGVAPSIFFRFANKVEPLLGSIEQTKIFLCDDDKYIENIFKKFHVAIDPIGVKTY